MIADSGPRNLKKIVPPKFPWFILEILGTAPINLYHRSFEMNDSSNIFPKEPLIWVRYNEVYIRYNQIS